MSYLALRCALGRSLRLEKSTKRRHGEGVLLYNSCRFGVVHHDDRLWRIGAPKTPWIRQFKQQSHFSCASSNSSQDETASKESSGSDAEAESPLKNTEFGYSRKDVILIGVGLIVFGYVLYYGLQAAGMEPGMAGNWVQLIIFFGICVGWVGSYLFRVATKQMTYVKQLEDYEEQVMQKRLEEMPEAELEALMKDIEEKKQQRRR